MIRGSQEEDVEVSGIAGEEVPPGVELGQRAKAPGKRPTESPATKNNKENELKCY